MVSSKLLFGVDLNPVVEIDPLCYLNPFPPANSCSSEQCIVVCIIAIIKLILYFKFFKLPNGNRGWSIRLIALIDSYL